MEANPSTSKNSGINNGESMRLLSRVAQKVKAEFLEHKDGAKLKKSYLQRVSELTGIHPQSLITLHDAPKHLTKIEEPIDRSVIYNTLTKHYLQESTIPSSYKLYTILQGQLPLYMDIESFRKLLMQMDFVWKRIGSGLVVIERPQVTFERYHYTKSFLDYDSQNFNIYFIDENYLIETTSSLRPVSYESFYNETVPAKPLFYAIYAVSRNVVKAAEFPDELNKDVFEDWLVDKLLPIIDQNSVIVMNNAPHHCEIVNEPPTLNSLKSEMMEWLDIHNVPYDIDMSKYELHVLVNKFTNTNKSKYKIDNIIEAKGYKVLRIPNCIDKLTPTTILNEFITVNLPKCPKKTPQDKFIEEMKLHLMSNLNCGRQTLHSYYQILKNEVTKIADIDNQVDNVWDEVVANTIKKIEVYEDSDFPISDDD